MPNRRQIIMVLLVFLAWVITFMFFRWCYHACWLERPISQRDMTVVFWLLTFLISTSTVITLGLKNILLALLLALPGLLFLPFAMFFVISGGPDVRFIVLGMFFFFFVTTCGTLLLRSYKDEERRSEIYQGVFLVMLLLVAVFFSFA